MGNTKSMGKIDSIQIMRASAVALVVARHAFPSFAIGGFGVDIFFVVSGFIIATIAPGQSTGEFLFGGSGEFTRSIG